MSVGVSAKVTDSLVFMGGGGSPVDIDGTLVLLIGLFLFLMWYLNRSLFRPYLAMKDVRYERIEGAKQTASEMQDRAERVLESYQNQLTEARQEASGARADLRAAAKTTEQSILGEARADIEKTVGAAREALEAELAKAEAALNAQAKTLSTLIVDKVLAP